MLIDLLLLTVGIALLLAGGEFMVRGAASLAKAFGVSSLIIGLTVVAFGTSAPELAINMIAAINGNGDISFGNIIGSNIANIGLIIGLTALIRPLEIHSSVISRELPMMLLATVAAVIMGLDHLLRKTVSFYDRADGLLLLLLFCIFIHYTISEVLRQRRFKTDQLFKEAEEHAGEKGEQVNIGRDIFFTVAGMAALVGGGRLSVDAAVSLAVAFDVPKVLIGLTLVALGTSLPELVTSIVATYRGQTDIAIGNVVGSNIFNLLFVMGLSSTTKAIPIPPKGAFDLAVMAFLSFLLLPFTITHNKRIVRWEGVVLLAIYIGYTAWITYSMGFGNLT